MTRTDKNWQTSDGLTDWQTIQLILILYKVVKKTWNRESLAQLHSRNLQSRPWKNNIRMSSTCTMCKTFLIGEKSRSQSSIFWHIQEKQGFHFLMNQKVGYLLRLIAPSDEIDRVSKFDNSLSFGAKQNALRQTFFALWFFKDLFTKNLNWIFFYLFWF